MKHSPVKGPTLDEAEAQTIAALRRLKRFGVQRLDFRQTDDGQLVLRASVQRGRAHQHYETGPHDDQDAAIAELVDEVGAARQQDRQRRRGKPTAKRVQRPGAGEATGPVDDRPLADRLDDLPPAQHAKRLEQQEQRRAQREREKVAARHRPERPAALPPGDRPGRGGGR